MPCSVIAVVFFFSSRRRHTRSDRDWSSDVCSSDLRDPTLLGQDLVPAQEIVLRELLVAFHLGAQLVRQVAPEPAADLVAEGQLVGRIVQIHVRAPVESSLIVRLGRPPCYRRART